MAVNMIGSPGQQYVPRSGTLYTAASSNGVITPAVAIGNDVIDLLNAGCQWEVRAPTVNTALTTVGAGTITGAGIAGGLTTRGGAQSGAAFTDTTDTAANIVAGQANPQVGEAWLWRYQNNTNATATITGGTGVTVSGVTIIPAGNWGEYLVTYTAANTITMVGFESATGAGLQPAITNLTTVGAGTITAAGIVGGFTNRSGPTAAATDTTDTAANIIAAEPNAVIGQAWEYIYINTANFPMTLTGGTGVTVSGITVVPANSWARYLITYTAAATLTMVGVSEGPNATLPDAQYTTAALQSTVALAANIAGAKVVAFENTGTTPANLQFDTAANIVAAIPNAKVGMSYLLKVRNSSGSANTATMTTNTGITLHGTMTIAQNVTREFLVVLTSLTAVDIYSMGVSAAAV